MNIYCSLCKRELEIESDLGTEIHVFGCCCADKSDSRDKHFARQAVRRDMERDWLKIAEAAEHIGATAELVTSGSQLCADTEITDGDEPGRCPSCGDTLTTLNRNVCQNCGYKLFDITEDGTDTSWQTQLQDAGHGPGGVM